MKTKKRISFFQKWLLAVQLSLLRLNPIFIVLMQCPWIELPYKDGFNRNTNNEMHSKIKKIKLIRNVSLLFHVFFITNSSYRLLPVEYISCESIRTKQTVIQLIFKGS